LLPKLAHCDRPGTDFASLGSWVLRCKNMRATTAYKLLKDDCLAFARHDYQMRGKQSLNSPFSQAGLCVVGIFSGCCAIFVGSSNPFPSASLALQSSPDFAGWHCCNIATDAIWQATLLVRRFECASAAHHSQNGICRRRAHRASSASAGRRPTGWPCTSACLISASSPALRPA
jgi:hypothetical protein